MRIAFFRKSQIIEKNTGKKMEQNRKPEKEKKRIIVNTQMVLDLTGWDIHKLMQILQVPEDHRQPIIDAITKD